MKILRGVKKRIGEFKKGNTAKVTRDSYLMVAVAIVPSILEVAFGSD